MEKTLIMIKPDAVKNKHVGHILTRIEEEGFQILALRYTRLSLAEARKFYEVHKERPFYDDLCKYMSSGPIVAAALARKNAIAHWREVIGATDPAQAGPGTIRALYAESKEANAVHGSDAPEAAAQEIAFHFKADQLVE